MSDPANLFISKLKELKEGKEDKEDKGGRDQRALAALRRSLAFKPGKDPRAFPYIEPYVERYTRELKGENAKEAGRLALYTVAGLYAKHSEDNPERTLARGLGELAFERGSPGEPNKSIEKRFIALLEADAENVHYYLRQAISLLAANEVSIGYAQLLDDLFTWMNPWKNHDDILRKWARDFYGSETTEQPEPNN